MNATRIRNSLPDTAWRQLEAMLAMPALLVTPARPLEDVKAAPGRLTPAFLETVTALAGAGRIHTGLAVRAAHAPGLIARLRLRQGDTGALPDAVLCPADAAQTVALLRTAAEAGVPVGPQPTGAPDAAHVAMDLSALNALEETDTLSGRVRAGGGMSLGALDAALAGRGLMLRPGPSDAAMTVARWAGRAPGLGGLRLASPKGLAMADTPELAALLADGTGGLICAATLAVCARPADTVAMGWHLPDFAAGLALLREAARRDLTLLHPLLHDEPETRFLAALAPALPLVAALWARLRDRKTRDGALLTVGVARADLARFRRIAAQAGARPARAALFTALPATMPEAALLERGAAMDTMTCRATWARLPRLYAGARAALGRAMAQNAPRQGAQGVVMAALEAPDAHGATLTFRWIFARNLGAEAHQARIIRAAARRILAPAPDPLVQAARQAVARVLDPQGIIRAS